MRHHDLAAISGGYSQLHCEALSYHWRQIYRHAMMKFCKIDDDNPALQLSPMICAADKLLAYLIEHEEIGLTKSKAFKRSFVHWAAGAFAWPGFEEEKLFQVNKVLNEYDFPPLEMLHFVMLKLKLVRHFKGTCRLTRKGKTLAGKPGALFGLLAPFYLFQVDHGAYSRTPEPVVGNWDVFLNVINVDAANGLSGRELRQILFGPPDAEAIYDRTLGMLWSQVLRPLCWLGLLAEQQVERTHGFEDRIYATTPLWRAAFDLETDSFISRPTWH